MAITEQSRHDLYVRLEAALGAQEATTLMEHLPPVGWADVSTRTDVALQLQALEGNLRAEFHLAFGDFRDEMHRSFGDFRDEMHRSFGEFRDEMLRSSSEFRDEMRRDRQVAQRQLLFVLVVALVSLLGTVATSL
ncbi:MAG: hypothetical protein KDB09_13980 [Acidimicrobiales bacterium]|nr:hypothetical protein [Acidimicrobiales bacterium]